MTFLLEKHAMRVVSNFFLLVIASGALAACSVVPSPETPPPGSQAFQQAYLQGCHIGWRDAGSEFTGWRVPERNDVLYASSSDYHTGWDAGHNACYEDEHRAPHFMRPDGPGSATTIRP
jgi:hypothetical protein